MSATPSGFLIWGLASIVILMLAGCEGMPASSATSPAAKPSCAPISPSEFAYVLNGDVVSMYTVNSCTGQITPSTPAIVPTGSSQQDPAPEQMVADNTGRFAYVANLVSNAADLATISMFTINSTTGVLTPTTPPTIPTGFFPQGIAIDPSGRFVYTANSDDNTVSMFTIDSNTGILIPTTPPTVATGWSPLSVTIDPSGRFAYVANQDDDTISMYDVDSSTGVLTPMTPATVSTGGSPFGVTVDRSGRFAYAPNAYDVNNAVWQYIIDSATGVLTQDKPNFVISGNQPASVAVDPSSKFVYVVNRSDSTVSIFTIDPATGTLTANGSISTATEPFRILADPSGKYAYVADEGGEVSIYSLNSNGALTAAGSAITASAALSVAITAVKH